MSVPPGKGKSAPSASRRRRAAGDEAQPPPEAPPGTESPALTPGLAMMQEAVRFTAAQVLAPPELQAGGPSLGANALAEQAGAMMIEDVRGFLQGAEMILLPALARALDQTLKSEPAGPEALAAIESVMTSLSSFSGAIIATAATTRSVLD